MHLYNPSAVSDELWALANGPIVSETKLYSRCIVNEVRFHAMDIDARRKFQNSGVVVEGMHDGESIDYYGCVYAYI